MMDKELTVLQNQPGGSQYKGAYSICASSIVLQQLSLAKCCFETSMQNVSYKVCFVDMSRSFAQHVSPRFTQLPRNLPHHVYHRSVPTPMWLPVIAAIIATLMLETGRVNLDFPLLQSSNVHQQTFPSWCYRAIRLIWQHIFKEWTRVSDSTLLKSVVCCGYQSMLVHAIDPTSSLAAAAPLHQRACLHLCTCLKRYRPSLKQRKTQALMCSDGGQTAASA